MVQMSRIGSLRHTIAGIAVLAGICGCSGGGGSSSDEAPPTFAGLETATVVTAGTARLTWSAASDPSGPITYHVWRTMSPGMEAFNDPPAVSTQALTIDITGLPPGAMPSYFVVRAEDALGNRETNVVEKSVAFAQNKVELLGSYDTGIASDIAVHSSGNLVAMGSFTTNPQVRAWLFDVSNPASPQLVSTIYGPGRSTDVEIRGNTLWVSTEDNANEKGLIAYDIADPANPVQLSEMGGTGFSQCHTIWVDGTTIFCASTDDGEIHLADVSDPANPVPQGSVGVPGGQVHDMWASGDVGIGCFLWDGWAFLDLSSKTAPVLREQVTYSNAFTHNAWPTADGSHVYTTDENQDGHIRIWDVQNRADIKEVGSFVVDEGAFVHAIVHNVQIVGNRAYIAWYEAGVTVLDVTLPEDPVVIGYYDTFPNQTAGWFNGAWSAAPHGDKIYVSDLSSGLYVLQLNP